jgi:chorismate dehydratase
MNHPMQPASLHSVAPTPTNTLRVGSVSFLNAKPLIYGLAEDRTVALKLAVPSQLLSGLEHDQFDVALLPVIDYQRLDKLVLVPSGGIGSQGETLTVRIFSKKPINQIRTLACDTDSHTSVALARVILADKYHVQASFSDLRDDAAESTDARLLIGDKVVCEEPLGFDHQLDLGQAWRELTGLPFVFAIWTARAGVDLHDLPQRLIQAREQGMQHIGEIVEHHALSRGWPADLATQYLTSNLNFEISDIQLKAIETFHEACARHKIIPSPPKPLCFYRPPSR